MKSINLIFEFTAIRNYFLSVSIFNYGICSEKPMRWTALWRRVFSWKKIQWLGIISPRWNSFSSVLGPQAEHALALSSLMRLRTSRSISRSLPLFWISYVCMWKLSRTSGTLYFTSPWEIEFFQKSPRAFYVKANNPIKANIYVRYIFVIRIFLILVKPPRLTLDFRLSYRKDLRRQGIFPLPYNITFLACDIR